MTRNTSSFSPCPLCGRQARAHSRILIADVEPIGTRRTSYATVICRDCAFAMVLRSEAAAMRAS
ncbi:hypothetical protein [Tepidiforma thermophila]|uniref:Uncharacterized protein n=1 Tax=Tepidiforma thermophila (strain KCTC 52669 / CGMCC 1.13589 / G233) TaxID=2761530 RepID=A0A2A9HFE1_TEPT2|nr:hypothetical protein [Tepidiforma thermophila]PFG74063.1 hypothetical protein A9A59_1271 [Tepidiforma thermophila]